MRSPRPRRSASIQSIPNHNDTGSANPGVDTRNITGILVAGTGCQPDHLRRHRAIPRIGAGPAAAQDLDLDTNSGMISRLTWNGTSWQKLDLVRGLPRSEENHAANGLQLDPATNTLYVSQGGNTNKGAPSNNFALLPEYALSAADPGDRSRRHRQHDLRPADAQRRRRGPATRRQRSVRRQRRQEPGQARPGGPVQVHAPGFRNPYDLLDHRGRADVHDRQRRQRRLGRRPGRRGARRHLHQPGQRAGHHGSGHASLHEPAGYYGGHPNPTRGQHGQHIQHHAPASRLSRRPNPVECDYRAPGPANG